ncbi:hypothetical protein UlMin_020005 [Ulmus minor]
MEHDEILKLVSSLKIDDEENDSVVWLGDDLCSLGEQKLNSCLACKVYSSKALPRDLFRNQIPKILQLVGTISVELIGSNLFILEFSSMRDRKRVLTNGPWNFFKNLVIFTEINADSKISSLNFDFLELWIQINNIPLSCMNRECDEVIGNSLGKLTEDAMGNSGECWGQYLRMRVSIDASKPLKHLIRLGLWEGSSLKTLLLQYERLPTFCFRCGIMGHQHRECLMEPVLEDDAQ